VGLLIRLFKIRRGRVGSTAPRPKWWSTAGII